MGKTRSNSTIVICVAVALVAVIAVLVVWVQGYNNRDELNAPSADSSTVDTLDNSSEPSTTTSSETDVTSSENAPSSSKQESTSSKDSSSKVTSSNTSSDTSSIQQVVSTTLPTADDNPFGVDKTEGERICYLTFDDGPATYTEPILNTLKDNGVRATFFVVGTMGINKIKLIYDAGHAIGLHTNTHELNQVYASPEAFIKDLTKVSDVVYNKTGVRTNLTRFPGGSTTAYNKLGKEGFETVKDILKEKGYTYFDWNIDSGDTHAKSPSEDYVIKQITKNVTYNGQPREEICLLFHDIKKVTSQVLDRVIKDLKEQGYVFKALDSTCKTFAFK